MRGHGLSHKLRAGSEHTGDPVCRAPSYKSAAAVRNDMDGAGAVYSN